MKVLSISIQAETAPIMILGNYHAVDPTYVPVLSRHITFEDGIPRRFSEVLQSKGYTELFKRCWPFFTTYGDCK